MVTAKWIGLIYDSLLSLWCCLFAHHNQKCQRILSDTKSTGYCQRSFSLSSIVLHRRNSEALRLTCLRSGSWTRAELREEPKDISLCSSTASDGGLWCGNLYLMSYRMEGIISFNPLILQKKNWWPQDHKTSERRKRLYFIDFSDSCYLVNKYHVWGLKSRVFHV